MTMAISERKTLYVVAAFLVALLVVPPLKGMAIGLGLVMPRWVYLLVLSTCISFLATPIARRVAIALGALDRPGERKVHERPTPLFGGAAVYGAFSAVILLNFSFSLELKGVALGSTLVLLLGLVDDLRPLPAWFKLLFQFVAVGILIKFGVVLNLIPDGPLGTVGDWVLTALWVLGITNAMNFLDGLDGLATGLSAVSSLLFMVIAMRTGQAYMGFLSVALLGSCLGFLPHNFRLRKPASIFLGDAGSTFLGFTLAGIAVMGEWAEERLVNITIPVLILGVPIFDMVFTTVTRVWTGKVRSFREWLSYTGRDHFHHRLLDVGLDRRGAVLVICIVSFLLGLSALVLMGSTDEDAVLVLLQATTMFALIAYFMIFVKRQYDRIGGEASRVP
ncbi:MAG: undecaprenyl/decaprenyl-phosphate alpha-N-acetylglucosaminyl 1-phosphate transferase [Candidatus Latescibacterota bacterium]|nr:MAG: undecaprenyl/decaprenyl-phosphate alpha-N-acetylglucosaminyl 1-phosphate transferase [Candidatus Latescibacterota bacterium]